MSDPTFEKTWTCILILWEKREDSDQFFQFLFHKQTQFNLSFHLLLWPVAGTHLFLLQVYRVVGINSDKFKKKKNTPLFYIHLYSGTELLLDLGSGPPDFFFLIFTIYIYNLLFLAICFNKIDLSPLNIIIDIFKSYKYYPNNKN